MALTMKAGRNLPVKFSYETEQMTAEWTIHSDDDESAIIGKLRSMLEFISTIDPSQPAHYGEPQVPPRVTMPDPPAVPNGWELIAPKDEE